MQQSGSDPGLVSSPHTRQAEKTSGLSTHLSEGFSPDAGPYFEDRRGPPLQKSDLALERPALHVRAGLQENTKKEKKKVLRYLNTRHNCSVVDLSVINHYQQLSGLRYTEQSCHMMKFYHD